MSRRTDIYRDRLEELGGEFKETETGEVVEDYGRPSEEYEAIREGAGLIDFSERDIIAIGGPEAVPWLQGLVTNDLLDLEHPGSGQRTCILDSNGRILAAPAVLHIPEMLLLTGEANTFSGGVKDHLKAQIITEDVDIHDRTEAVTNLGLVGPESIGVLNQVGQFADKLDGLDHRDGTWGQIGAVDVVVQRTPITGGVGFSIIVDSEDAHRVFNSLLDDSSVEPVGESALENARLEAGIPRFGEELDNKTIPLEADLESKISFDKGCYLGQEIIVRMRDLGTPAKRLRTLVFEGGAAPAEGADIEVDDRSVGEIRSSAWSPLLGRPIGLGYVKRSYNDPGSTALVEGREAEVRELGNLD
jgi:folate-binding protein YgfZ